MGKVSKKIIQIYNKLNQGDEKGFLYYSAFLPLYLSSLLYGIGVRFRFFLYRIGLFKTRKLDCKVISIGNITVGGSGKTPMTIFLAEKLKEKGKKVVILSRGYKGKIKDIGVVSDGKEILLTSENAGDEPYLMAAKLKNIPVVIGRDRYKAGCYAVDKFNPDVIILDDGFQHVSLYRDIDILLVDSKRGFGNGHLFPLGVLREPLRGLKRASFLMIKGKHSLSGLNGLTCPIISFNYKPKVIDSLFDDSILSVNSLKGKKIAALSGIADPKSFKDTLEGLGASVKKEIIFPDHHAYTHRDVQVITKEIKGSDMLITTMKDAVKLKSFPIKSLPIYVLDIEVEIENLEIFEKVAGLSQ